MFTTPSNHRVHHSVNFKYLDKNFGDFWDRLFGTFGEETDKVVYGMYSHLQSWNPISINFHYYKILWKESVATPYTLDKFKLWFMPLGWVPRGLSPEPALVEITTQNQNRFQTVMFPNAKPYLIVQAILGILLMMIIKGDSPWSISERWVGAALLWYQIINWSGILESKSWLWISENIRIILTIFAISVFSPLLIWQIILFAVSALGSIIWCWRYFR